MVDAWWEQVLMGDRGKAVGGSGRQSADPVASGCSSLTDLPGEEEYASFVYSLWLLPACPSLCQQQHRMHVSLLL